MPASVLAQLANVREVFNTHLLFGLGVLLVGSFFFGRLAERAKLPSITGCIVAGFILGPSVSGLIGPDLEGPLTSVTEAALAIIALAIGSQFNLDKVRKIGRAVLIITLSQLLLTFGVVTAALVLIGLELPAAALLGAIASATAPEATVAIVRALRARGSFVDHLYGVVALDDAGCILLFSIVMALAGSSFGGEVIPLPLMVLHATREIVFSVAIGLAGGFLLHILVRGLTRENEVLLASLGLVLLMTAVSSILHCSTLLACMAAGAALVNLSRRNYRVFRYIEPLAPLLYAAFFAIAGTKLSLSVFATGRMVALGLLFVFSRGLGKYYGVLLGSVAAGSPAPIRRLMGLCMLPQGGVAIGLVIFLQTSRIFSAGWSERTLEISALMVGVVLFSVFVNALIGPPLTSYAVGRGAVLR